MVKPVVAFCSLFGSTVVKTQYAAGTKNQASVSMLEQRQQSTLQDEFVVERDAAEVAVDAAHPSCKVHVDN